MLSPNYLQTIADELVDDFAQLENDILSDIAMRIKENDYSNTSTAQFRKEQLQALGMSSIDIQKRISNILKISEIKVSEILSQSVVESVSKDNKIINDAFMEGIIPSFSFETGYIKDIILNGINDLNVDIKNICNTTAVTSKNMLYQSMNKAYLQITSGAFSYDEAMDNVIRELSKQGISIVDYKSGAHRRLDSGIRNAVRTAVNKTSCDAQERNLNEQGVNLVETTSHWGARPSHAEWQGKIFYRNEEVEGYQNFYDATGYGKGSGLGGWNCRHSFYPFYEGLSEKSFEHIDKEENEEYYNLAQEQRYNERMIREWRRRRDVCKAGGIDFTKEKNKLREWNARQKELLDKHPELKRNFALEKSYLSSKNGIINLSQIKVSGALDPTSNKANKHAEQYYESVRKMKKDYKKIAANTGYLEDHIKQLKDYIFIEKHELIGGIKRFDPDFSIAQSWQRLISGKSIQPHDLLLLEHEAYERALVMSGVSQLNAHDLTNKIYNYAKGCDEYYGMFKKFQK